jgi:transcription-repair coupling factor (superfamily II helicase)
MSKGSCPRTQRLALYKRLTAVASDPELAELSSELTDRFGPMPPPAAQLLDIVRVRAAARRLGIEKIEAGRGKALVTFTPGTTVDPVRLVRLIHASRGRLRMKREFTLEAAIAAGEWAAVRDSLLALLEELDRR